MKKLFSFILVCLIVAGFFIYNSGRFTPVSSSSGCQVYFVDRQMHKLIPTFISPEKTTEQTAEKILSEIISGRDNNSGILRIVPNIEDSISVKVSGEIAYVNLSGTILQNLNKSRDTETLLVYQIVNSLVSVDGIEYVSFTIDDEIRKDFLGFLDMRGLFTADYDV